jgi:hypothetical protein
MTCVFVICVHTNFQVSRLVTYPVCPIVMLTVRNGARFKYKFMGVMDYF